MAPSCRLIQLIRTVQLCLKYEPCLKYSSVLHCRMDTILYYTTTGAGIYSSEEERQSREGKIVGEGKTLAGAAGELSSIKSVKWRSKRRRWLA